jgi:sigma-E factor negative regulatory protein RseA
MVMGKLQDGAGEWPAQPLDKMAEEISQLMDGELDPSRLDAIWQRLCETQCESTWVCFHTIGDTLRGTSRSWPGFAERLHDRLTVEPTVLAPQPHRPRPLAIVWAAAASVAAVAVVGWVAVQTMPVQPTVIATARPAAGVRPADTRTASVDNEYLLAHQEFSPTTAIQGVGPYMRAVTATEGVAHP